MVQGRDLEVILDLPGIQVLSLGVDAGSQHVGALVHVGEEESGADRGLCVEAGAAVAMPASADLEVEGAVNSVLLGAENRRQVLRHFGRRSPDVSCRPSCSRRMKKIYALGPSLWIEYGQTLSSAI